MCSRSSSSSPGELQPVFNALLENATRICEATFGMLFLFEGDAFHQCAVWRAARSVLNIEQRDPLSPAHGTSLSRRETKKVQFADVTSEHA